MRVAESKILQPRSINFVDVNICTVAPVITTRPYNFDKSLLLANSINTVVDNKTIVLLANVDVVPVELTVGQQVASYEEYESDVSPSEGSGLVNSVIKLGDTSEVIMVGDDLDENQLSQLSILFSKHIDAFSIQGALGRSNLVEHEITLKPDARPIAEPIRRRPIEHVEETKRQVKEMLEAGIIEPSASPWASAYVIVKKKGGDYRLCVDFRGLNAVTKKDSYPLPHIEACIEAVAGKRYYSTLDFASGF